jgi:hypothetical protein
MAKAPDIGPATPMAMSASAGCASEQVRTATARIGRRIEAIPAAVPREIAIPRRLLQPGKEKGPPSKGRASS